MRSLSTQIKSIIIKILLKICFVYIIICFWFIILFYFKNKFHLWWYVFSFNHKKNSPFNIKKKRVDTIIYIVRVDFKQKDIWRSKAHKYSCHSRRTRIIKLISWLMAPFLLPNRQYIIIIIIIFVHTNFVSL